MSLGAGRADRTRLKRARYVRVDTRVETGLELDGVELRWAGGGGCGSSMEGRPAPNEWEGEWEWEWWEQWEWEWGGQGSG